MLRTFASENHGLFRVGQVSLACLAPIVKNTMYQRIITTDIVRLFRSSSAGHDISNAR